MVRNTTSSAVVVVSEDPISERAYEIYVERGGTDGSDWDDWFQAEGELAAKATLAASKGSRQKKR